MAIPNADSLIYDTRLKEARDYWIEVLTGSLPLSNIILDRERPHSYPDEHSLVELNIVGEVYHRIAKITNDSPFLLYALLLTSLMVSIRKHTGNSKVVIGSPPTKELGWPNVLAIVCDCSEQLTFRDLLLKV